MAWKQKRKISDLAHLVAERAVQAKTLRRKWSYKDDEFDSELEWLTAIALDNAGIKYQCQYNIPKDNMNTAVEPDWRKYRYDFYLPELNILLECQGLVRPGARGGHNDADGVRKDIAKLDYAMNNNYGYRACANGKGDSSVAVVVGKLACLKK